MHILPEQLYFNQAIKCQLRRILLDVSSQLVLVPRNIWIIFLLEHKKIQDLVQKLFEWLVLVLEDVFSGSRS